MNESKATIIEENLTSFPSYDLRESEPADNRQSLKKVSTCLREDPNSRKMRFASTQRELCFELNSWRKDEIREQASAFEYHNDLRLENQGPISKP